MALLIFSVFTPLMALSPNVWVFTFLYLIASIGSGVNNTVHNSYLSDAYPTEGRGRVFSWHNLSDPLSQTVGILIFGLVVTVGHNWRWGMLIALVGIPIGAVAVHPARAGQGAERVQPHPEGLGHGPALPAERRPPGPAGLGRHPPAADPLHLLRAGGRGHPGLRRDRRHPCSGTCTSCGVWGLDTAQRSEVYSIIGLAAFLGLPLAYVLGDRYFRRAPQRPWSSPGSASPPTGACTWPRSTCPSCGWW